MRREEVTRGVSSSWTVAVGKSLFIPNDPDRTMLRVLGTGDITFKIDFGDEITTTVDFFNDAIRHPVVTSIIEIVGTGSTINIVSDCICDIVEIDATLPLLTGAPGIVLTGADPSVLLTAG